MSERVNGAEVVSRYEAGEGLYRIARSLGRQYRDVRAAFDAAGGRLRTSRTRKLSIDDRRDIIALYQRGETINEIANQYDVARTTVRHHLRQAGFGRDT